MLAATAWFLVIAAAITGYWVVVLPVSRDPLANDFTLVFMAVRIGLDHGWSHIYSLALQHQVFTQVRPGAVFNDGQLYLAPPPLAWLTLVLAPLGAAGAFYAWTVLSLLALVAAWWLAAPGDGAVRLVWLAGALAWYPVLYALAYGQPAFMILLAVVGSWWFSARGHPYPAGLALAVATAMKPQLALGLPIVLLAAGRWRVVATWAAATGVLAAISVVMLGSAGWADYRSLIWEAQGVVNNRYFTLAYVLGPGFPGYAAQVLVLAIAAVSAYLNRAAPDARLFALGMVATAFGATYWHLQDFAVLLAAAWLFWRSGPPVWQRAWLVVVAMTMELAWPLTPLPLLVALGVWFVMLAAPAPAGERPASTLATA